MARRGKAKPGRARGLFAPPSKQVLDRTDSKLGKRRRTADYDFGDVIMPPLPGAKALAQLPVSPCWSLIAPVVAVQVCMSVSGVNGKCLALFMLYTFALLALSQLFVVGAALCSMGLSQLLVSAEQSCRVQS